MKLDEIQPGKLLELTSAKFDVANPFRCAEPPKKADIAILSMPDRRNKDLYEEWLDSYGGVTADSCDGPSYADGGY